MSAEALIDAFLGHATVALSLAGWSLRWVPLGQAVCKRAQTIANERKTTQINTRNAKLGFQDRAPKVRKDLECIMGLRGALRCLAAKKVL